MHSEWKWLFEGEAGRAIAARSLSDIAPMDPGLALAAVFAAEDALAAAASLDLLGAYLDVYVRDDAADVPDPTPGPEPRAVATMATLGGEASATGDLAWTYGAIDWVKDANPGKGYYVRVWQRRPEGWRIVFDELLATPPGQHQN